ncbi:uncharacterized protein [Lolium perenne]|uniref:uncharacterized protein n=1 Tax=Lolium perenne TaxID=4522 RepID=UPI0021F5AF3C|nr:uncharacterized protein LOC127341845 [Lolium perenne]
MDLPLALSALLLLLAVFLAPTALLFLAFHHHPHHPRPTPSPEPAAANLDPPAPPEDEKRPRRRAKRKQQQQQQKGGDAAAAADDALLLLRRPQFPLASVAGPLQRRITARYDDLARASHDHCLTVHQIREFLNCLVDARNELLHKSEIARRSFTIKKALLSNSRNCRSSYDQHRLSKQVDKLESEHERLKKDAAVYNFLQEQLRMSDHYKLMMELNDAMEKKALEQALADEESQMSFEELLEEEKKDAAFWWRDGKLRSISDCK